MSKLTTAQINSLFSFQYPEEIKGLLGVDPRKCAIISPEIIMLLEHCGPKMPAEVREQIERHFAALVLQKRT